MTTHIDRILTNQEYQERFLLAAERIRQIPEETGELSFASDYFQQTASFLSMILDTYDAVNQGKLYTMSLEELQQQNHALYADILPEHYACSYANPDYAAEILGIEFGPLLCALYAEIRGTIVYAFEQNLPFLTTAMELYLEIYGIVCDENPAAEEIHSALYYYCFDYSDITVSHRTRELLDPDLDFCTKLVMESDLMDLRYLYYWGEYVSDNEYRTAEYLNTLPLSQIQDMAHTYTEGYRKGFEAYQIDLSQKKSVNIRYTLGFERIVREAVQQFESLGLRTIIYRRGNSIVNRLGGGNPGFHGGSANKQYDYDHRMDMALLFDKAYADRRLNVQRQAYEENKILASEYAGPALIETFGETPWNPQEKQTAPQYNAKQQKQKIAYQAASGMLSNEFIPGEEVSFTIIAYPVPEIGNQYSEIFDATIQVNTLDQELYQEIQTTIIEALDQGTGVQITGRGENQTDLYVALTPMMDPANQTRFENCLADVNIPLGEVFTSPQLQGTHGTLHVTRSFLNGLKYENIRLTFTDGIVTDYICSNYDDPAKNQKYIRDNLLFQHETLPMGEFAIGTNTTAYAMGQKYQISHLLPILIEEKTGPHFAIGDTCFSHEEDMCTYNPDGKEMIAKENDYSRLRHTEVQKAYFNCHTDITIPYHELGDIIVCREDGSQIPIIQEGRFVLPGTEKLNEPLG
ncbi:MAG: aminopeptidase [Lachnospiraceae bacterium]|nr:aminopeptidase [Lachnospiraceae bacterium]